MKVTHYRDVPSNDEVPGVAIHPVISAADGAPRFQMRVFEVQPGGSTPLHDHWWEHEVFILSGRGNMVGPDGPRPLQPEEAVFVPGGELHQFVNTGEEPFRFICCIPHSEVELPAADAPAPDCN